MASITSSSSSSSPEFSFLFFQDALVKYAYFNNKYYGTSSEDDIQKRLARAKVKLGYITSQSDDIIIVNDDM